jgi:hypothetical protein
MKSGEKRMGEAMRAEFWGVESFFAVSKTGIDKREVETVFRPFSRG